jgi:hypothetical protein
MTDRSDIPNATDRWRAAIEALEGMVQATSLEAKSVYEIDPAEAEEVRHLIMIRIAARRRSSLPAARVHCPGIVMPPKPLAELNRPTRDGPLLARPPWRE